VQAPRQAPPRQAPPQAPVQSRARPLRGMPTTPVAPASRRAPLPDRRRTFADVAKTAALIDTARAFPDLPPDRIAQIHRLATAPDARAPRKARTTTNGPNRRQILIPCEGVDINSIPAIVSECNRALSTARSTLRVESANFAYKGLSLVTTFVARASDLAIVRQSVSATTGLDSLDAALPQSRSFLKILDVPFPVDTADVTNAMADSPFADAFILAATPRTMRNSAKSSTATVWFDLWDSQSGARAKQVAGRSLFINGAVCPIRAAAANPGTPQCQRCWRWGHPTTRCRAKMPSCPRCAEPHTEDRHRALAGCCKGNAKANPPVPPTPAGTACPHTERCLNCEKRTHTANSNKCPFWRHRFNGQWIQRKYSALREGRALSTVQADAQQHAGPRPSLRHTQ
jgi:hypothetical protein